MNKDTAIKLFESKKIRSIWNDDEEKWYFSIVDVIEVLTGTDRPRKYWSDLKSKLNNEGSELSDKIGQLKMEADDGKLRLTDVADTEQLFRLIQSIPSPKAESFKKTNWKNKIILTLNLPFAFSPCLSVSIFTFSPTQSLLNINNIISKH